MVELTWVNHHSASGVVKMFRMSDILVTSELIYLAPRVSDLIWVLGSLPEFMSTGL